MIVTPNLLYHKNSVIGILNQYFSLYFQNFSTGTAETLFLFVLSMLAVESARSVRYLYVHFISKITNKSINAFYYACYYAKIDYTSFMKITAKLALKMIPEYYNNQPVFLCIDDTLIGKFGQKFEDVSKLFDHSLHNGSNFINGHCFVSLMLCVPVRENNKIHYCSIPLGYTMWKKDKSKIELAKDMVDKVMPTLSEIHQVILLFDSWYAKKPLTTIVSKYANLDIVCNARYDSAIYDLPPQKTGKKGRPAKKGKRLSLIDDFKLSENKIGDYYIGYRNLLTNIFGNLNVMTYVTANTKNTSTRRLFFSTMMPHNIHISCATPLILRKYAFEGTFG